MSTKAKRHIHKYYLVSVSGVKVWACALPDCNHYMPAHMSALVPGKASLCWNCGEQMILDGVNMKMAKPFCLECGGQDIINLAEKFGDEQLMKKLG